MFTIEKIAGPMGKDRLTIRSFKDSNTMHKFLNTGANGLTWRISERGFKSGTYAFAGGKWHNVKNLDTLTLAHI